MCPTCPPTGYKTWQPPRGRQSQHRGIPPPAPVPPDSLGSVSSEAMGGPPIHSPVGKPSAASGRLLAATVPPYLSGAIRGWAATEGDPLRSPPAACGFGVSSGHPAQLFLCDPAPAKPLALVLPGPPDSCAHIHCQLASALPGNLKHQARAFPQVPARSSPPAAAGSPARRVLPPSARSQSDALPKTKNRIGTFHIFLVDLLFGGPSSSFLCWGKILKKAPQPQALA